MPPLAFAAVFAFYLTYLPRKKRGTVFAIESANIVGYTTKEAAQGKFIILGAQFEGVKGGTKINDLIGGVTGVYWDEEDAWMLTAPQIQVPNGAAYTTYYYLQDGYVDEETVKPGWCNGGGNIVDDELIPGVAMWAKSIENSALMNVSGAVASEDSASVQCPTGFALRANIFPVAIPLNSEAMMVEDIAKVYWDEEDAWMLTAPQIQVPNGAAYTTYYYLQDGYVDEETVKPGWCNGGGNIVDDVIPAAQGFWTKGVSGAFTLKFTK